jgi:isopentenyl phosphate kinase
MRQIKGVSLIKLGGSVVTFKDRPLAANIDAINGISRTLARLKTPCVIVHGGGSFGHYWSAKYNMHTRPASYSLRGISVVHESMIALNQIIVNAMIKAGLHPYGIPPSIFAAGHKPIEERIKQIHTMARLKIMPVTFGDIVHTDGSKYSILSGDAIMTILALALRPSRVIFATDVDGIYTDIHSRKIVSEMRVAGKNQIAFSRAAGADVTGGMQRKVTEAFKIASCGMDVLMVNGLVPGRIAEAVSGRVDIGTLVKGGRR